MKKIKLDDDSQWPDSSDSELEWRLRYVDEVTKSDRLTAASIISAYEHLLHGYSYMPEKLRKIRKGINKEN